MKTETTGVIIASEFYHVNMIAYGSFRVTKHTVFSSVRTLWRLQRLLTSSSLTAERELHHEAGGGDARVVHHPAEHDPAEGAADREDGDHGGRLTGAQTCRGADGRGRVELTAQCDSPDGSMHVKRYWGLCFGTRMS